MAKSLDNLFLQGASGTIGKMMTLTRKKSGRTVLGKHRGPSTVPATDGQLSVRDRFRMSIIYAKAAMANPEMKEMYAKAAKGDQSAYNVAVRDAYKAPEITAVTTEEYTGNPGSSIIIRAIDDFKVGSVRVIITNGAGALVEQGFAVLLGNGLDWIYTATGVNDAVAGSVIKVIAKDLPANETVKEVVV